MGTILLHPRRTVLALVLALGCGGALGGGGTADAAGRGDAPARCEIRATRSGGLTALEALVRADAAVDGSYSFDVAGRGTNVRQGGAFRAAPGRPAMLGRVTLNAVGAAYDIDLTITVDGDTIACSKRIGGGT